MKPVKLPMLIPDLGKLEPPKIPDKMVWTQSALKCFRSCKRKFFWKYIMRLVSVKPRAPLLCGHGFHGGIADWLTTTMDEDEIVEKQVTTAQEIIDECDFMLDEDEQVKLARTVEMIGGMLLGYFDVYAEDRDLFAANDGWAEGEFILDCGDFYFAGKVDAGMTRNRRNILYEHKTASAINEGYVERLPIDTQTRSYCFGATNALEFPVNRVCYNVARKSKLRRKANEPVQAFMRRIAQDYMERPTFYFHREELHITRRDIASFEDELWRTHAEYQFILDNYDPYDPRSWVINDAECYSFNTCCDFISLDTRGLDRGNGMMFEQIDEMHDELEEV